MAKQSTVWLSDRGEQCRSEKDALLADAGNKIEDLIAEKYTGSPTAYDTVFQFLTTNTESLRTLLLQYEQAAQARWDEVNS